MKIIFLLVFSFQFLPCFSQMSLDSNYQVTIKGDVILTGSSRIMKASMYGYYFDKFYMLSCGSGEELDGVNKISEVKNFDSTLLIKISIENNCCKNYLAEIDIIEDSILNIVYNDYGDVCMCDCNFCLDYEITYSPERIRKISQWEKKDMSVKYAMINWDRRTLVNIQKHLKK